MMKDLFRKLCSNKVTLTFLIIISVLLVIAVVCLISVLVKPGPEISSSSSIIQN